MRLSTDHRKAFPPFADVKEKERCRESTWVPVLGTARGSYRSVLTLDAGAVEAQSGDAGHTPRDVEDALVVALARLRLREVLGRQCDGFHHSNRDVDLS